MPLSREFEPCPKEIIRLRFFHQERWLSGRKHVPAKDAYLLKEVSRVQIPLFPIFAPQKAEREGFEPRSLSSPEKILSDRITLPSFPSAL